MEMLPMLPPTVLGVRAGAHRSAERPAAVDRQSDFNLHRTISKQFIKKNALAFRPKWASRALPLIFVRVSRTFVSG